MANLLVVVDDVSKVVSSAIVGFAHAHRVVCEINIAVVTKELRHFRRAGSSTSGVELSNCLAQAKS